MDALDEQGAECGDGTSLFYFFHFIFPVGSSHTDVDAFQAMCLPVSGESFCVVGNIRTSSVKIGFFYPLFCSVNIERKNFLIFLKKKTVKEIINNKKNQYLQI